MKIFSSNTNHVVDVSTHTILGARRKKNCVLIMKIPFNDKSGVKMFDVGLADK